MLEEIKHIKISKDVSSKDDLDFAFLKSKGIEYLESMGADLWSDFNVHDPGITFLELISYGITDLGNRINLPIENLIASKDDLDLKKQFNQAHEILPTKPTNALDYRKLFSDIPGVRNSWIYAYKKKLFADCKNSQIAYKKEPLTTLKDDEIREVSIKGLNALLVDYDYDYIKSTFDGKEEDIPDGWIEDQVENLNKKIREVYHKNRNLCEDLVRIEEVKTHPIGVCTTIELEKFADEDLVHAQILEAIENYFSPRIEHHSLKEMVDRGYRTDQIFEGPFLESGFIDPKEMEHADLRSEVRLSDLVKLIMEIDGVKLITDILIKDCKGNKDGSSWLIEIPPYTRPSLCSTKKEESEGCCTVSSFSYVKDVLPITYSENKVKAIRLKLLEDRIAGDQLSFADRVLHTNRGVFMDTSDTTTLQNELPETYGVSQFGLPSNSSEARKAQALQLKGYLLFFDQIFATYFSHLAKVKDLLSIKTGVVPTYFTQAVKDLKDIDKLVVDYDLSNDKKLSKALLEDLDNNIERRNAILDHLLARFAENFTEYTFLMRELYGKTSDEMVLNDKETFLKDYVDFSSARGTGYNVLGQHWATEGEIDQKNVSGAQKRIARRTGIPNFSRRNISASLVDIYIPDTSTTGRYMWKVTDHLGNRLLNSSVSFDTKAIATKEVNSVIEKLIKLDVDQVRKAFEKGVAHGDFIDCIMIYERPNGQFKFNVVDLERKNAKGDFEIIGIFAEWDETLAELRDHLIGIIQYLKYDLNEEGMYIVEHVLMLPNSTDITNDNAGTDDFLTVCIEDCDDCCSMDPYSFKVSVVLPGYTHRFSDPDFRSYMEQVIQAELPSHVIPRICWIGHRATYKTSDDEKDENQLVEFEIKYKKYLEQLKALKETELTPNMDEIERENTEAAFKAAVNDFATILFKLNTLHPVGRLHDCESEDDLEGKIILGRTNL